MSEANWMETVETGKEYVSSKRGGGPQLQLTVTGCGWAVDPKSLVIEESTCEGKTKKGYKCRVIYRAKNGFGGYVRESVSLIMAYDVDSKVYQCIDIH